MKRLFIAIPVEPQKPLMALLSKLKNDLTDEKINWVKPENLHFTLLFLGETDKKTIPAIISALDEVSASFNSFDGKLKGLGYFPSRGNPRVLYVNLVDENNMGKIAEKVHQAMQSFGFKHDYKEFVPHLTLARIKFLKDKTHFFNLVKSEAETEIQNFTAKQIILYESILQPSGPVYRTVKKFELPDSGG